MTSRVLRQAVVLAGGLGSRMQGVEQGPKFLFDIAGEPFGFHLLRKLQRCGFDEVLLLLGHGSEAIVQTLAALVDGPRIRTARDPAAHFGTARALWAAREQLWPTFLLTYGDSWLPFDYMAPLAQLDGAPDMLGCMSVWRNADQIEGSNCAVGRGLVVRYDKLRGSGAPPLDHIDYGALALRSSCFVADPGPAADLGPLLAKLAARGQMLALTAEQPFFEIGSAAGLTRLRRAFAHEADVS